MNNRKWTFRAPTAEAAMDAMEREMARLGHRVVTHETVTPLGDGRWRVQSIIKQYVAK